MPAPAVLLGTRPRCGRRDFGVERDALDRAEVGQRVDGVGVELERHGLDRRVVRVDGFALPAELRAQPLAVALLCAHDDLVARPAGRVVGERVPESAIELVAIAGDRRRHPKQGGQDDKRRDEASGGQGCHALLCSKALAKPFRSAAKPGQAVLL
jgi:hypothetical protein